MPPAFCGTSRVEDVGLRVHFAQSARARDGGLARALNYAPERCAQARSAERRTEKEKERERERRKESRASTRARSCAMDGALVRALKYAPEWRAHGALRREKDRERST